MTASHPIAVVDDHSQLIGIVNRASILAEIREGESKPSEENEVDPKTETRSPASS
jgi:CBS-domain-containing membrane protein